MVRFWVYFSYFFWDSHWDPVGPQAQPHIWGWPRKSLVLESQVRATIPSLYGVGINPRASSFKFARQALYQLTELCPWPNFLFLSLFLNIVIYMNKFKQIYILRIIRSFGSQKKRNRLLFNSTEYILFVFIKIFESKKSTTNTKYLGKTEASFLTVFYFKLYAWRLGINGRKQLICSSATALGQWFEAVWWWAHSLASYQLVNTACLFPSWINLTSRSASVSPVLSCLQSNNQTQVFDTLWLTGYLSADRHAH